MGPSRRAGRLRRALLAAAACALAVWLSALAGVQPVAAANTASEMRVDPADRSSVTAEGGVRPFAGADRYRTAVLLAERYAQQGGGIGAVSTVVLVSGHAPAEALAAAGLAGRHSAPILLTRHGSLPDGVADFLERHGVTEVIAVGGTDMIADGVLDEVAALEGTPAARRVWGADRYDTAAAAARELGGGAGWCGLDGTAALLVNGRDEHLAAMAPLGALAFARELPILLTPGSELPESAVEFLRSERIERVVMVGSTSQVSPDLASPLLAAGVDEVTRSAPGAASSAAAVTELMTADCAPELQPSRSLVALADPGSVIDGVVAAPLLGIGLDGTGPVPLLMAASPLPRAVRTFLAKLPAEIDGRKNHVLVAAVGGERAVSADTVGRAVDAAASARALTARITATAGDSTLRIAFSESLEVDAVRFPGRLRDLLYVNGAPAWITGLEPAPSVTSDPCGRFSAYSVTLGNELEAGDEIVLEEAVGWHSTVGDRRPIRGATHTVAEPRRSFGRPAVEVIALHGQSELWVSVAADEYRLAEAGTGGDYGIDIRPSRFRVAAADGTGVVVGTPTRLSVDRILGESLYSFPLLADGVDYELAAGDRVIARSGLAVNSARQRSGSRGATVAEPKTRLAITAVRVGPPNPGVDDSVSTRAPEQIDDLSERATASLGSTLSIVGKWSGAAAGAAGNAWEIYSTRTSTAVRPPVGDPPATQVWVDARRQGIVIRHIDAPAGETRTQTYGQLAQLLNSNRDFSRHFTAVLANACESADKVVDLGEAGFIPASGTTEFGGGVSSVSFLVSFNDYVAEWGDGDGNSQTRPDSLIEDIVGGLLPEDPPISTSELAGIVAGIDVLAAPVPGDTVVFRFTTENPQHAIAQTVPIRANRIELREGAAHGYLPDDPDTAAFEDRSLRRVQFAVSSRDRRLLSTVP